MSQATESDVVTTQPPPPIDWDGPAADAWKEIEDSAPQEQPVAEPKKEAAPKPEPKAEDAIPDDLIAGTKDEKKVEEEDPDELLLNQKPNGQLKHEQFAALQEASKRRIEKVRAEVESKWKAELEAAKAAPKPEANPEEIKALREALQAKEEALERHAFEKSERFQTAFTRKESAIVSQATAYAKSIGADVDAVENAVKLGGSKAVAAIEALDINPGHQQYLINRVAELDATSSARDAALTRWQEMSKQWHAEAEEARKLQLQQQSENEIKVFERVGKEIAAKYPLLFNKREGQDAWNTRVEADGGKAFNAFKAEMDVDDYAGHQHKGAALDRAYDVIVRQRDLIESIQKENRELKSAGPNINGTKPPENKPEKRDVYDPHALDKAAESGWAAIQRGG